MKESAKQMNTIETFTLHSTGDKYPILYAEYKGNNIRIYQSINLKMLYEEGDSIKVEITPFGNKKYVEYWVTKHEPYFFMEPFKEKSLEVFISLYDLEQMEGMV